LFVEIRGCDPLDSIARVDILIRQALVTDGRPPVDIAIHHGRIAAIDQQIDTPARRTIEAGGWSQSGPRSPKPCTCWGRRGAVRRLFGAAWKPGH
jgi:hypothetical protein